MGGKTKQLACAAVQAIAGEKTKTVTIAASAASEFTSKNGSPASAHWADDSHALAAGAARALSADGAKSWFVVTVDIAFGTALQKQATEVVEASGGSVVGSVRHPAGGSDFSSLLPQAQLSGAKIIGLASLARHLRATARPGNRPFALDAGLARDSG